MSKLFVMVSPLTTIGMTLATKDATLPIPMVFTNVLCNTLLLHARVTDGEVEAAVRIDKDVAVDVHIAFKCDCASCFLGHWRNRLAEWFKEEDGKMMVVSVGYVPETEHHYLKELAELMEDGMTMADAKFLVLEISKMER